MPVPFDIISSCDWIGTLPHQTVVAELLTRPERTLKLLPFEISYLKKCLDFIVYHEDELSVALDLLEDPAEIVVLRQRAESLQQLHRELMAILSPIRRLPVELLSMIFCHLKEEYRGICLPIHLPPYTSNIFMRDPPFFDAMLVCRQWFNVCDASCPSLWADIRIDFSHRRSSILPRILSTTLRRSRGHPLSISLSYYNSDTAGPLVDEVYRLLVEHSDRWQTFDADMCSERECKWFEGVRDRLGCLRRLSLRNFWRTSSDGIDPVAAFRDAPNLHYVDLDNFPSTPVPSLDISRLTSFRWYNIHEELAPYLTTRMRYLEALQHSNSLSCFEYMTSPAPYTPRTGSYDPIPKPLVTELLIGDPTFLTSFLFPSLTLLMMGAYDEYNIPLVSYPPETLSVMHAMLEQSRCPLVTLVLRNVDLDPTLFSILRGSVAGSLKELTICLMHWNDEHDGLLQDLVGSLQEENSGAFTFLPSLQDLDLVLDDRHQNAVWDEYMFIDEVFASVVLSRLERSAVRTVGLTVWSTGGYWPIEESTLQVLRKTSGVNIYLHDFNDTDE
ncbi:hypothetical protein BDZ89DRAFT_1159478 [Hymenopellis radicata]|nr:hypothetical protein BDZ89DRAFT_1159478 [Hymenopellis radicata]